MSSSFGSMLKNGNRFRKLFIQNEQLIYSICLSKCLYSMKSSTNHVETQTKKSEKFHVQKKLFQETNGKQNGNTVVTQEEVSNILFHLSFR